MPPLQSIINKADAKEILKKKIKQFDLIELKATNSLYELSQNQETMLQKTKKHDSIKENIKEGVSPWNQSGKNTFYKRIFKNNYDRKTTSQCKESNIYQQNSLHVQTSQKKYFQKKILKNQCKQNKNVQLIVCLQKKKSFNMQKKLLNQSINLQGKQNKKIIKNWKTQIRHQEEKNYERQIFRKKSQIIVNRRHPLLRLKKKRTNKSRIKTASVEQYYSTNPLTRLLHEKYMQTINMRQQQKKSREIKLVTNIKTCPINNF